MTGQRGEHRGRRSGQISFSNNDGNENPFNFSATGTVAATPAEITVLGNGASIADGDITPSVTHVSDFGSATLGGTPVQHRFTVRNDGGSMLTTSGLTLPTGFSLVEGLSSSIAPGSSYTFTVQLDTTSTGTTRAGRTASAATTATRIHSTSQSPVRVTPTSR